MIKQRFQIEQPRVNIKVERQQALVKNEMV